MRGFLISTVFVFFISGLFAQTDSSAPIVRNDTDALQQQAEYAVQLAQTEAAAKQAQIDWAFRGHDPKKDANLNPFINKKINPDSNRFINPASNYNMNPLKENSLNPTQNATINPMINLQLNPQSNDVLNPVIMKSLRPSTETWKGLFLFNESNQLFGYISVATQYVMLSFDNSGTWNGYYVKAGDNMYNYFTLFGVWTGMFLCYDNQSGYNLFDKNGKWTHIYVK
jgi:hypothetical protein